MKALVCFKTMPDLNLRSGQDWEITDLMSVDDGCIKKIFNCYDESALEIALKLSRQIHSNDHHSCLTALTIDGPGSNLFLKHLLALEYDHAVRIEPGKNDCQDRDLRFDPMAVAKIIFSYIKHVGHQQLVITGTQGSVGDNGQTGMLIAEHLGWPCISDVTDVKPGPSSDSLIVTSHVESATLIQTIILPVVIVIGNSLDSPYLRVPTLKQKLKAERTKIQQLVPSKIDPDLSQEGPDHKNLIKLHQEKVSKICTFIGGDTAKEKAQFLFDQYIKNGAMK